MNCPKCNHTTTHPGTINFCGECGFQLRPLPTALFEEFLGVVTGREGWEVRPWGEDFSDTEVTFVSDEHAVFHPRSNLGCTINMFANKDGSMNIEFVSCRDGEEIHYTVPHITVPVPVTLHWVEAPVPEDDCICSLCGEVHAAEEDAVRCCLYDDDEPTTGEGFELFIDNDKGPCFADLKAAVHHALSLKGDAYEVLVFNQATGNFIEFLAYWDYDDPGVAAAKLFQLEAGKFVAIRSGGSADEVVAVNGEYTETVRHLERCLRDLKMDSAGYRINLSSGEAQVLDLNLLRAEEIVSEYAQRAVSPA